MASGKYHDHPEELPHLFKFITSNTVVGFDNIQENDRMNHQRESVATPMSSHSPDLKLDNESEPTLLGKGDAVHHRKHSVSISMPSSPLGFFSESNTGVFCSDNGEKDVSGDSKPPVVDSKSAKQFHSHPLPAGPAYSEALNMGTFIHPSQMQRRNPRIDKLKDNRFDSFKTWSGKLERQISHIRGKKPEVEPEVKGSESVEVEVLPVDRYFDALEGPELDTLKASEELVLPDDKQWPFLLRYPISSFGICLGVSSQAILWKTLATSASMSFLHISLDVNLVLWCISVALIAIVSLIYSLKVIFYFEAVRREYFHPVRVNFFFAPWIAFMFLALGIPPSLAKNLHPALWYTLMTPLFCLELKIYGQWMSGGQRRLSKVANPTNHLSIVGNFVGALLGATMGLKEGPIFFFSVGLAHYMVLFVTLYQRLPTNETLPKELHPVFFLFVAAPSVASMAWARIQGTFDFGSRIAYFIALFLYFSLAVRVNFFRGFRFSLSWWAYTFPMTGASIATIKYSNEVTNPLTQSLSVLLSAISTLIVTVLLISTFLHAVVLRDLFPNDIAIAIMRRRPKACKKRGHLKTMSSDTKGVEPHLKSADSDAKGMETNSSV